jgi:hypothetical protein
MVTTHCMHTIEMKKHRFIIIKVVESICEKER